MLTGRHSETEAGNLAKTTLQSLSETEKSLRQKISEFTTLFEEKGCQTENIKQFSAIAGIIRSSDLSEKIVNDVLQKFLGFIVDNTNEIIRDEQAAKCVQVLLRSAIITAEQFMLQLIEKEDSSSVHLDKAFPSLVFAKLRENLYKNLAAYDSKKILHYKNTQLFTQAQQFFFLKDFQKAEEAYHASEQIFQSSSPLYTAMIGKIISTKSKAFLMKAVVGPDFLNLLPSKDFSCEKVFDKCLGFFEEAKNIFLKGDYTKAHGIYSAAISLFVNQTLEQVDARAPFEKKLYLAYAKSVLAIMNDKHTATEETQEEHCHVSIKLLNAGSSFIVNNLLHTAAQSLDTNEIDDLNLLIKQMTELTARLHSQLITQKPRSSTAFMSSSKPKRHDIKIALNIAQQSFNEANDLFKQANYSAATSLYRGAISSFLQTTKSVGCELNNYTKTLWLYYIESVFSAIKEYTSHIEDDSQKNSHAQDFKGLLFSAISTIEIDLLPYCIKNEETEECNILRLCRDLNSAYTYLVSFHDEKSCASHQAIEIRSAKVTQQLLKSQDYHEEKKYKESAQLLASIADQSPSSPAYFFLLERACRDYINSLMKTHGQNKSQDYQEAIALLKSTIKKNTDQFPVARFCYMLQKTLVYYFSYLAGKTEKEYGLICQMEADFSTPVEQHVFANATAELYHILESSTHKTPLANTNILKNKPITEYKSTIDPARQQQEKEQRAEKEKIRREGHAKRAQERLEEEIALAEIRANWKKELAEKEQRRKQKRIDHQKRKYVNKQNRIAQLAQHSEKGKGKEKEIEKEIESEESAQEEKNVESDFPHLTIKIPEEVRDNLAKLISTGKKAFYRGSGVTLAINDLLGLGFVYRSTKRDEDIVTDNDPDTVKQLVSCYTHAKLLSSTGIYSFGVITSGRPIDITVDPDMDSAENYFQRCDFSIKTFRADINGKVYGLKKAFDDLKNNIIATTTEDSHTAFQNNPIKIFRCIDIITKTNNIISNTLRDACKNNAHLLAKLTYPLLNTWMKHLINTSLAEDNFKLMHSVSIIDVLFPELKKGCNEYANWICSVLSTPKLSEKDPLFFLYLSMIISQIAYQDPKVLTDFQCLKEHISQFLSHPLITEHVFYKPIFIGLPNKGNPIDHATKEILEHLAAFQQKVAEKKLSTSTFSYSSLSIFNPKQIPCSLSPPALPPRFD